MSQLRLVRLVALGQAHRVACRAARADPVSRPNASCAAGGTRGGFTRIDQVDAVDAAALARRDRVDDLARRVEHLELERAEEVARALVVRDHGAARRVRRRRTLASPSAQPPDALHALLHGPRRAGTPPPAASTSRVERAQRRDVVDDPDAAAVRGEHQIVVARLHREIAHRDGREVAALELRPRARRRRARSTGRTRCRRTAGPASTGSSLDHVRVAAHALLRRRRCASRSCRSRSVLYTHGVMSPKVWRSNGDVRACRRRSGSPRPS